MDRFFGLDHPANEPTLTHLCTLHDPVTLAIAEEILTEAGLPYLKKERGSGGVVRIMTGFQSFGTDLFVRPEDKERADELLVPLFTRAEDTEQTTKQEDN
ncbi:MAG: hypothetical protein IJX39_06785 [Clostridia bacterium]|nr:hypothetical protein [Clostridia bacterium]